MLIRRRCAAPGSANIQRDAAHVGRSNVRNVQILRGGLSASAFVGRVLSRTDDAWSNRWRSVSLSRETGDCQRVANITFEKHSARQNRNVCQPPGCRTVPFGQVRSCVPQRERVRNAYAAGFSEQHTSSRIDLFNSNRGSAGSCGTAS